MLVHALSLARTRSDIQVLLPQIERSIYTGTSSNSGSAHLIRLLIPSLQPGWIEPNELVPLATWHARRVLMQRKHRSVLPFPPLPDPTAHMLFGRAITAPSDPSQEKEKEPNKYLEPVLQLRQLLGLLRLRLATHPRGNEAFKLLESFCTQHAALQRLATSELVERSTALARALNRTEVPLDELAEPESGVVQDILHAVQVHLSTLPRHRTDLNELSELTRINPDQTQAEQEAVSLVHCSMELLTQLKATEGVLNLWILLESSLLPPNSDILALTAVALIQMGEWSTAQTILATHLDQVGETQHLYDEFWKRWCNRGNLVKCLLG